MTNYFDKYAQDIFELPRSGDVKEIDSFGGMSDPLDSLDTAVKGTFPNNIGAKPKRPPSAQVPGTGQSTDKQTTIQSGQPAHPRAKKPTIEDHYTKWVTSQSPTDMTALVNSAKPIIDSAITTYAGGNTSPVVRSRAKQIVINAIKRYDPESGVPMRNWLMTNLQELRRISSQLESPIVIPERVKIDAFRVRQVTNEFEEEHGRSPSISELSDLTGLNAKRIAYVKQLDRPTVTEGQFTKEDSEDSDDIDAYLPGVPGDDWMSIWAEYVYHDLDEINKKIFDMYVGRGGYKQGMTVNEMAKELGMSAAAVSQRAKKISDKLEEGLSDRSTV